MSFRSLILAAGLVFVVIGSAAAADPGLREQKLLTPTEREQFKAELNKAPTVEARRKINIRKQKLMKERTDGRSIPSADTPCQGKNCPAQ